MSTDNTIRDYEQFKQIYLGSEFRSDYNREVFSGNSDLAPHEAVGKIVFDACWYSDYDPRLVFQAIEDSAYDEWAEMEEIVHQIIEEAKKLQDGTYGD